MTDKQCILCGPAAPCEHYAYVDGNEYLRCGECGLVFVKDIAPTETLYHSYGGGLLKSLRRKLFAPLRRMRSYKNYEQSLVRGRQMAEATARYAHEQDGQISFLDVGANRGFLLAAALEQGWDVYGIEIVPELLVPFANTYPSNRNKLFSGRFTDCQSRFRDEMFDAITAIDVIEHLEDPVADLRNIHRILKPGGIFLIQTPDTSCSRAREEADRWGALKPLEHLFLFDPQNLQKLASQVGFAEYQILDAFEEADGNFAAVMRKQA